MLSLFEKYLSQGKFPEALMVGQNLFNKHSSDKAIFQKYFDLLISLAEDSGKTVDERRGFFRQAVTVLAFFSENVEFDESMVEYITNQKSRLDAASDGIESREIELRDIMLKEKIKYNDECLSLIGRLASELEAAVETKEFEKRINQIGQVDAALEKEYFTKEQEEGYVVLTRKCSEIVDRKTREFDHKRNVDYNLRAIEAYEKIFALFKENRTMDNHKEIVREFFAFDASRLFNETLVYYNHVYSYVLSKLDDNGKLLLTKYAIMSERRG